MKIITGYTGTSHITAAQDGAINIGLVGGNAILKVGNRMAATIQSNNEVRISDGVLIMQGRAAIIEPGSYDSLAIASGTQSKYRKDLIVARYEVAGSGAESITLKVIQGTPVSGTPAAPSYTSGDIYNGATVAELPLWYVNLSGTTISSVSAVTSSDEADYAVRLGNHANMVEQIADFETLSALIADVSAALGGITITKLALAANTTKTINVTNGTQLMIVTIGAAAASKTMRLHNFSSAGAETSATILDGVNFETHAGTRSLEVTANATLTAYIFLMSGSITSIA